MPFWVKWRLLIGTLIALFNNNKPIFGIIDIPILDELWLGINNYGSFLNNNQINVSKIENISKATIATTSPDAFSDKQIKKFKLIQTKCLRSVWGGDCHNYGLLASGYLDIVIECNLQWYDVASLIPVIEEAGGIVSDWSGNKLSKDGDGSLLICNSEKIHSQVIKILEKNEK